MQNTPKSRSKISSTLGPAFLKSFLEIQNLLK